MTATSYLGHIQHFIFPKGGLGIEDEFGIAKWKSETGETFVIKGSLYEAQKDERIEIYGHWESQSKYGKQFIVDHWQRPKPKTREQIKAFLSSKVIKGCGKRRAEIIVNHLGEEAIERIMNEGVQSIAGLKGIGNEQALQITESIRASFELQEVMMSLLPYGITPNVIIKVYKKFGSESVKIVRQNPYKLTEIEQISFQTADEIAKAVGIRMDSPCRINACILSVLTNKCYSWGHCYIPAFELIQGVLIVLNRGNKQLVTREAVHEELEQMEAYNRIVWEADCVYLNHFYVYETKLAKKLAYAVGRDGEAMPSIENFIRQYQMKYGIVLAEKQREAIRELIKHQVLIITGNPGTGKTTIVKAMIEIYLNKYPDHRIGVCAPISRVARNLNKLTGLKANTINNLLGFRPGEEPKYNENLPVPYDLLFVDEASTLDLQMAFYLVQAIGNRTKLVFIGDSDQLPSVGPGSVLQDMIIAGVPHVRLTEIFRQAQDSQIITNAYRINHGLQIVLDKSKDDYFFIEQEDPERIAQLIERSVLRFLDKGYSIEDVLVLSPMKKGVIGTEELNLRLQASVNPAAANKMECKIGKYQYRQGDRIIRLSGNDYEKDVLNGDIGTVIGLGFVKDKKGKDTSEKGLICSFYGKKVILSKEDLRDFGLGYCSTIHKTIGSEAPIVIMPMSLCHERMLTRKLAYTGSTRAKRTNVIIGTRKALNAAIQNNKETHRNTKLAERIASNIRGGQQWQIAIEN